MIMRAFVSRALHAAILSSTTTALAHMDSLAQARDSVSAGGIDARGVTVFFTPMEPTELLTK